LGFEDFFEKLIIEKVLVARLSVSLNRSIQSQVFKSEVLLLEVGGIRQLLRGAPAAVLLTEQPFSHVVNQIYNSQNQSTKYEK